MASGASAAAAATVAVLAIMVLSSQGDQVTRDLCSECARLCTISCTDRIYNNCRSYCANPFAARQDCEKQVFQACTVSNCCNKTCGSHDCRLEAENACEFVQDTTIRCQFCRERILQFCPPACYHDCNKTCVEK